MSPQSAKGQRPYYLSETYAINLIQWVILLLNSLTKYSKNKYWHYMPLLSKLPKVKNCEIILLLECNFILPWPVWPRSKEKPLRSGPICLAERIPCLGAGREKFPLETRPQWERERHESSTGRREEKGGGEISCSLGNAGIRAVYEEKILSLSHALNNDKWINKYTLKWLKNSARFEQSFELQALSDELENNQLICGNLCK